MATKKSESRAAAKAKKQKIILIGGAVLLLGLGALQGPKLLKHGGSSAAPPPAENTSTGTAAAATPTTPVAQGGATPAVSKPAATVAGVGLPGSTDPTPATSQLASFTLFRVKDPFVPGVNSTLTGDAAAAGAVANQTPPAVSGGGTTTPGVSGSPAATGGQPPVAAKPDPLNHASIKLDGKMQEVEVKNGQSTGEFPADQPLFVLVSVKKGQAKIAVAGGSFADADTITLKVGKKVTLVNTATQVRYELLLVRVESAASFTPTTDTSAGGAGTPTTATSATATPTP